MEKETIANEDRSPIQKLGEIITGDVKVITDYIETIDVEIMKPLEETIEPISSNTLLSRWLDCIKPYLKPGGKPVALILSLGIVSIPLLISGNIWVAPILATGASIVAVRASW